MALIGRELSRAEQIHGVLLVSWHGDMYCDHISKIGQESMPKALLVELQRQGLRTAQALVIGRELSDRA